MPLDLEQTGRPLVVRLARDATRNGGCPRESGETSLDVVVFVLVAALGRKPFGTVPEVMLAMFWCNEIVDGITGKCDVRRICVHLAVLEHGPLDVSTIETAHSISTNERSSDIIKNILNSVICAKYINIKTSLPVYEVVVEFQHTELGVLIDEEPDVMRQVVGHARLARRYLVGIIGDDVQLSEPLVIYTCGRTDFIALPNIAMFIDVGHRLAVRRIAE